ncbi:MAG: hypothetical protein IPJ86_12560 [Bacteroidetes bacterium]|nr:hypothetical protein [Bacteroidota bacterium]
MLINFSLLPPSSRIWIFQSSRILLPAEVTTLQAQTDLFLQQWTAHKADLNASSLVVDDLFLIVAVDESEVNASGCSIDKLYQFVKNVQQQLNIDLLDRLKVAFVNSENTISTTSLKEMESMIQSGRVDGELPVYDLTVTTVGEFSDKFKAPLKSTWLNRFQPV